MSALDQIGDGFKAETCKVQGRCMSLVYEFVRSDRAGSTVRADSLLCSQWTIHTFSHPFVSHARSRRYNSHGYKDHGLAIDIQGRVPAGRTMFLLHKKGHGIQRYPSLARNNCSHAASMSRSTIQIQDESPDDDHLALIAAGSVDMIGAF